MIAQMLAPESLDRPEVRAELGFLAEHARNRACYTERAGPDPQATVDAAGSDGLRADTEADPGILPSTRDDVE